MIPMLALETEKLIGAGSAVGVAAIITITIKSLVWDKKNIGRAYIDGWEKRGDDLDAIRSDFEDRLAKMEEAHAAQLARVERQVEYLRHALVRIVPLVREDKIAEAVAILAAYGLPDLSSDHGYPAN